MGMTFMMLFLLLVLKRYLSLLKRCIHAEGGERWGHMPRNDLQRRMQDRHVPPPAAPAANPSPAPAPVEVSAAEEAEVNRDDRDSGSENEWEQGDYEEMR